MPKTIKTYNFTQDLNKFEYDDSLIEVSSGYLKLKSTYSTNNPDIVTKKPLPLTCINSFVPTTSIPANTAIKYTLIKDGQDYYYNSGWVESDGTYSKANTLAEIQANIATFTTSRILAKVRVFLSSTTGSATPGISLLKLGYTYTGYSTPDDVRSFMGNTGLGSGVDDEDLISAIEAADSQIDAYICNYELPLASTPAQIRDYSKIIAAYNIYSSLEVVEGQTKSPQRVRYEQALKELEQVLNGKKAIQGLTALDQFTAYSTSEDLDELGLISDDE